MTSGFQPLQSRSTQPTKNGTLHSDDYEIEMSMSYLQWIYSMRGSIYPKLTLSYS